MGINTTVIPRSVDVDNETIIKNESGKIKTNFKGITNYLNNIEYQTALNDPIFHKLDPADPNIRDNAVGWATNDNAVDNNPNTYYYTSIGLGYFYSNNLNSTITAPSIIEYKINISVNKSSKQIYSTLRLEISNDNTTYTIVDNVDLLQFEQINKTLIRRVKVNFDFQYLRFYGYNHTIDKYGATGNYKIYEIVIL